MSHLHAPDGILPLWLVLCGWGFALAAGWLALRRARSADLRRRLPLLGFLCALMVLAMSLELLPLAYHLNLSVVAGILLGPSLGFLAACVVALMLALVGHGGLSVVGLNGSILGAEVVLGSLLFRALRAMKLGAPTAAGLSTLGSLAASTTLMVTVVWAARISPARIQEHHPSADFHLFLVLTYGLGAIGWAIEALVTTGIVRYIARVRPSLVEA